MNRDFLILRKNGRHRRAVALVIVLAFVVLVTVLVVAFFSRTLVSRQVSNSSAGQAKSEMLARSAVDIILGDLKQEIVSGSTTSTSGNYTIYTPTSAASILPARSGNPSGSPDPIPNLVRRSVRTDSIAPPGVASRASAVSSLESSQNDRSVSAERWNRHLLIPRLNAGGNATDTTPIASFTPPDWVILTRNGPTALNAWNSSLSDSSPNNTGFAVGRYAFAIYDEGGLLDVNVAGYPSGLTPAEIGQKGALALADLTQLPTTPPVTQFQIDQLVGWRNNATAQPGLTGGFGTFSFGGTSASNWLTNFVRNNTSGFTMAASTASPTDQAFVSRQQLIKLSKTLGISQDALQYLGTSSRSLNAPTFTPTTVNAFNSSLINQRVTVSFTRTDGTVAQVGEPLLKHRFPLNRLAWITRDGPSATASPSIKSALLAAGVSQATIDAGTADNIQKSFGLSWNGSSKVWTYNHGSASSIFNLSQVATAGREPDFFELLQGGILNGSLGKNFPTASGAMSTPVMDTYFTNTYFQILQLGLNVIDQYGLGSFPTNLNFNGNSFYGIKNLPYINRIFEGYYRFPGSEVVPGYPTPINQPYLGAWFHPEIWNPHQNATTMPNAPAPTQFRFRATGSAYIRSWQDGPYPSTNLVFSPTVNLSTRDPLQFSNTTIFADPQMLTPSLVTGATVANNQLVTTNTPSFVGFFVGQATDPALDLNPGYMDGNVSATDPSNVGKYTPALFQKNWSIILPNPTVNFYLDYLDPASNQWVPYNQILFSNGGISFATAGSNTTNEASYRGGFRLLVDPRSQRFGPTGAFANPGAGIGASAGQTLRPSYVNSGFLSIAGILPSGWNFSNANNPGWTNVAHFGGVTTNKNTEWTWYADPDGVQRLGDAAYASNDIGQPLTTQNYTSRPVILNRPFRSVAEMGYAFRDTPWKSLDFFTANSGDSALLDLFCLQESPVDSVVAGTVNLNTRQKPVLQAVLAGATKDTLDNSSGISTTELPALLTSITDVTSLTPLINRSDLATKIGPVVNYAAVNDNAIKAKREAAVRALSDSGDTRTWNLLIDVIAQSGRYPTSATSLSGFVVEGERRYWLHVAIDRFTGKIISQNLESVYE